MSLLQSSQNEALSHFTNEEGGAMTLEDSLSERSSSAKDGRAVAHLLRQLRENRSASQTDLAKLLGRSSSLVSRLESGERFPTQALLEEIVRALALSDRPAVRVCILGRSGRSEGLINRRSTQGIPRLWCREHPNDFGKVQRVSSNQEGIHSGLSRKKCALLHG